VEFARDHNESCITEDPVGGAALRKWCEQPLFPSAGCLLEVFLGLSLPQTPPALRHLHMIIPLHTPDIRPRPWHGLVFGDRSAAAACYADCTRASLLIHNCLQLLDRFLVGRAWNPEHRNRRGPCWVVLVRSETSKAQIT